MYQFFLIRFVFSLLISVLLTTVLLAKSGNDSLEWKILSKKEYSLHYTQGDKDRIRNIDKDIQSGTKYIAQFFKHSFPQKFNIYIFPGRSSLNKQWQKDWGDSTFQSQCWMIASGVAYRLDILSPNVWTKEACDHNGNDSAEIRQVTWHELVHVFHGQYNPDHGFNYIEKLDWLVEGAATYISGQLNEKRLARIKQIVRENEAPSTLDDFWKGKEKYGLSGSIVAYIDKKYGREKLFGLLKLTVKQDVLKLLGHSEEQLLKEWKESF